MFFSERFKKFDFLIFFSALNLVERLPMYYLPTENMYLMILYLMKRAHPISVHVICLYIAQPNAFFTVRLRIITYPMFAELRTNRL